MQPDHRLCSLAPMFKDGTYAAWFKTSRGEGTGIVHFADGRIWGSDSIITYDGSYKVDGDRFTAILTTRRHTAGHATVFGIDQMTLKLVGVSNGKIATCSGRADEVPGMAFEAALILREDPFPTSDASEALVKFRGGKLPKPARRLRRR